MPERDAEKVMRSLTGAIYKGRQVRCNPADEAGHGREANNDQHGKHEPKRRTRKEDVGDWRQFFTKKEIKLKGEEPDFSEEGWARRKPKKK